MVTLHLSKSTRRAGLRVLLLLFFFVNAIAFFHAWQFTHFTNNDIAKTKEAGHLSAAEKLKILVFGVDNPRPMNKRLPEQPFETVKIPGDRRLEAWHIKTKVSKGAVVFFHGYGGEKSGMLDRAHIARWNMPKV